MTKELGSRHLNNNGYLIIVIFFLVLLGFILFSGQPFSSRYSTVVTDRNGNLVGARISTDGQWRFPEDSAIPDKFTECIIQFEDNYFYFHPGINPVSLLRAAYQNIRAGKIVSGGSTITMQVIRLQRKNRSRTFFEKFVEILLAARLELICSKQKIISLYANNAPFGGNVIGISAASWRYFGRPPKKLSWAESALLAVLPNSPSIIHPGKNRNLLLEKRNRLLQKLCDDRVIGSETYKLSLLEPLPEKPLSLPDIAPQLTEDIKLTNAGEKIVSSVNITLQRNLNRIVSDYYNDLKNNDINNLCALIIDVNSGNILAYCGNVPSNVSNVDNKDVDCIQAPRSTGSILKPFLYMAAQQEGLILPATLLPDIPTRIDGFKPENYDMKYAGAVPAKRALARSLNIPAVRLLQMYGIPKFEDLLQKMGMSTLVYSPDHYGLTLIVGGAEGKLWDLTNMYAGLAYKLNFFNRNGVYPENYSGNGFYNKIAGSEIGAGAIWLTFQALLEVNRPDEESGWKSFSSSRKISWKTGTSYGCRDGWAIGVTPEFAVGVWVGNADGEGRPGLTGVGVAAPLMFQIFNSLPTTTWFKIPYDDLIKINVCRLSGYKAGPYCEVCDTIYAARLGEKTSICPYHILVHLDAQGKYRVNSKCYSVEKMKHVPWFVLPPAMEYYYQSQNFSYRKLPPLIKDFGDEENIPAMELIYPTEALKIFVPREIDGSPGSTIFQMVHRNPDAVLFWHVDDEFLGTTKVIHQIALRPKPGRHLLTVVDDKGRTLARWFDVVDKK